ETCFALRLGMAMGTRRGRERQEGLWVATATLARPASHPFYERLNRLLDECGFDDFVESACRRFYAASLGRPSLAPGMYFRLLMVGYFEGLDSERGLHGGRQTRWASARFFEWHWTSRCPTKQPSRGPGD